MSNAPNSRGRKIWRRASGIAAAALGASLGAIYAEPVAAAAGMVWKGYVVPAYQAMIENGLLAWCL